MALAHPFARKCRVIEQAHVRKIVEDRLDDLRVKLGPHQAVMQLRPRTRTLIEQQQRARAHLGFGFFFLDIKKPAPGGTRFVGF